MTDAERLRRYKKYLEKLLKKVNDALTRQYSKRR
tara:strand:+ start:168 stop:269 length:102 start_codon:yes stop_codon:yes gene_type:complete